MLPQVLEEKHSMLCTFFQKHLRRLYELEDRYRTYACDYRFGKGGETFHRGYYLPSPVKDIFITNKTRGRLIKRPRKNGAYDYRYWFDQDDRLIFVERFNCQNYPVKLVEKEILFYQGNNIFAISYNDEDDRIYPKIECITEAVYSSDNRITEYTYIPICSTSLQRYWEIVREEYSYDENRLVACKQEDYLRSQLRQFGDIYTTEYYQFQHNSEDAIISYMYESNSVVGSEHRTRIIREPIPVKPVSPYVGIPRKPQ